MSNVDGTRNFREDFCGFTRLNRGLFDPRSQALSFNKRHRIIVLTVATANVINGDNPGVVKFCRSFCLLVEPLNFFVVRESAGQDHFQRHSAIQPDLLRLIYHSHPAMCDHFDQLVVTKFPIRNIVAYPSKQTTRLRPLRYVVRSIENRRRIHRQRIVRINILQKTFGATYGID